VQLKFEWKKNRNAKFVANAALVGPRPALVRVL